MLPVGVDCWSVTLPRTKEEDCVDVDGKSEFETVVKFMLIVFLDEPRCGLSTQDAE